MNILKDFLTKKMACLREKNPSTEISEDYVEHLCSVYPFNRFEYQLSILLANNCISINDYYSIRAEYIQRNKYLYLFEMMAPRDFGEKWAQRHLCELVPELLRPSGKLDPFYSGEYDFWYDGVKVEVKASRAVAHNSDAPLVERALSSSSSIRFSMNFQQLKPDCCDVFVWVGVWIDRIRYWVLSSDDVKTNKYFSCGQHRGNRGEGQLWIKDSNIKDFIPYETNHTKILQAIVKKGKNR